MTSVPDKTRKLFELCLIVPNGHLPHFCPTFNMAALLLKRSIIIMWRGRPMERLVGGWYSHGPVFKPTSLGTFPRSTVIVSVSQPKLFYGHWVEETEGSPQVGKK